MENTLTEYESDITQLLRLFRDRHRRALDIRSIIGLAGISITIKERLLTPTLHTDGPQLWMPYPDPFPEHGPGKAITREWTSCLFWAFSAYRLDLIGQGWDAKRYAGALAVPREELHFATMGSSRESLQRSDAPIWSALSDHLYLSPWLIHEAALHYGIVDRILGDSQCETTLSSIQMERGGSDSDCPPATANTNSNAK